MSNFAGDIPFKSVNLIMPFIMIVTTVGFMFGTGGSALVANALGSGDTERAQRYFSLFVYVSFSLGVVFALLVISCIFLYAKRKNYGFSVKADFTGTAK